MSPMFKQKVGMTKIYAKGIAELFLIRCNPYHWDGSGEVPDNISFDVYKRKIDETYDGCTLEIQLCKPDGCLCYAASVHLYEGGFWTGHIVGKVSAVVCLLRLQKQKKFGSLLKPMEKKCRCNILFPT